MTGKERVYIAMSGGVDSSVAACLLLEHGYECTGLFMITNDQSAECRQDAQKVADQLGIQLDVLDLRDIFRQDIIEYFCNEYQAGRTPNPCVYCNRRIKFGLLWDYARQHGARFLATGHYALIEHHQDESLLFEAENTAKDQSYVLSMVRRDILGHILLLHGHRDKHSTRRMAAELGLHIHRKADSQEICFIPDDDYIGLLEQKRPAIACEGDIVDSGGRILGRHKGIHRYTIGQRRGLNIALGYPVYVTKINADDNTVVLGPREELLSNSLTAVNVNWLINPLQEAVKGKVKIRYNHTGSPARIIPAGPDEVNIKFDQPVSSVTPGQAAVMYIENDNKWQVIGAGWIK